MIPPNPGAVKFTWLWAVIAVAVVLRLGAAFYMGDQIEVLPGIHDQVSYDALARSILAGQGYSFERDWYPFTPAHMPTAHWSFLYPLYLAGVYALFGPHPLAARLIQAAISGALTAWLLYRLGRRLFSLPSPFGGGVGGGGNRIGLAAAALSAVYIYFIYYDAALMTESFYTAGILAMLNLALDISDADAASPGQSHLYSGSPQTVILRNGATKNPVLSMGKRDSSLSAVAQNDKFAGYQDKCDCPTASLTRRFTQIKRTNQRPSAFICVPKKWILLGIVLGFTTLLRQSILPFVPFLLAWLYWATRNQQTVSRITHHASRFTFHVSRILCTLLILVAFILPWTLRNYRIYGAFLPLNSNAGYALYSANHPDHGTHFMQAYAAPLPPELAGLNEAQLNSELMKQGLAFMLREPGRYLLLSLSRVPIYFKFWPSVESHPLSNVSRVLSFGLYLPFFLYGLYLSRRHWRRCSLLYLFGLVYSLMHILTWASIRYRLPVDAAFMPFAALAVVDLGARMREGRHGEGEKRGRGT